MGDTMRPVRPVRFRYLMLECAWNLDVVGQVRINSLLKRIQSARSVGFASSEHWSGLSFVSALQDGRG
jgi:hypothetical protein